MEDRLYMGVYSTLSARATYPSISEPPQGGYRPWAYIVRYQPGPRTLPYQSHPKEDIAHGRIYSTHFTVFILIRKDFHGNMAAPPTLAVKAPP